MAEFKEVKCKCGQKAWKFRIDLDNEYKNHTTCPHCNKSVTIIYGKNKIKLVEGYA